MNRNLYHGASESGEMFTSGSAEKMQVARREMCKYSIKRKEERAEK